MSTESPNLRKPTLAEMLPQAAPMILLSGYETPGGEDAIDAFVDISSASPFFDAAIGGVPSCVALEYMAQTMALCVGFHRRRKGLPPKLGFILGSRRLSLQNEKYVPGKRYRVHAICTFQDEEFGSFDCTICEDGSDVAFASATLTAYQPGTEMLETLMTGGNACLNGS